MKQTSIIQRLCLFLFVLVLASPAWSYSTRDRANDRNDKEVEGKRTLADAPSYTVKVDWSDCKRNTHIKLWNILGDLLDYDLNQPYWTMKKGSTLTITCIGTAYVRGIRFRGALQNTTRLTCTSDGRYSGDPGKDPGLTCYYAPSQKITLTATEDITFAEYSIEYVKDPNFRFDGQSFTINVDESFNWRSKILNHDAASGVIVDRVDIVNGDVAEHAHDGNIIVGKKAGTTKLIARVNLSEHFREGTAEAELIVKRIPITPYIEKNTITMSNMTCPVQAVKGLPDDYEFDKLIYRSGNESVIKIEGNQMKFAGTGGATTIFVTVPADRKYEYKGRELFYNVHVPDVCYIYSKEDWKHFCDLVNSGNTNLNAKLMTNIDLGSDVCMLGTLVNKYSGTFDGQGNSIKMNWNVSEEGCAPFRVINGATIKNVYTQGDIATSFVNGRISGMTWKAWGNVTFTNCSSTVNLNATKNNGQSAGFIIDLQSGANATLTDCMVGGAFKGASDSWRGFVFSTGGNANLENCLYVGTNTATTDSRPFAYGGTFNLTNCYYLNPCGNGEEQGTHVTADQIASGAVANMLQNGRENAVWGQLIGNDNQPLLTKELAKQVYKVEFTSNGKVITNRYANPGKTITLPTAHEILGSSYDPNKTYKLAFSEEITSSTPINGNMTIEARALLADLVPTVSFTQQTQKAWELKPATVSGMPADYDGTPFYSTSNDEVVRVDQDGNLIPGGNNCFGQSATITITYPATTKYAEVSVSYTIDVAADKTFTIASVDDWKQFCEIVNRGLSGLDANLTQDLDLASEMSMVANFYCGTFDGQGHSITVDWRTDESQIAIFQTVRGATIKNLHTKGRIATTNTNGGMSGMVWLAEGNVNITNCSSMIDLAAEGDYASWSSGMVGYTAYGSLVKIQDCVVGGKFMGNRNQWHGFVRYQAGWTEMTNCIYIGEPYEGARGYTFVTKVDGYLKGALNNCYYLKPCGEAQGEPITEEMLKGGKLANLLQGDRVEQVWGQALGTDDQPLLTADEAKRVYEVKFTYEDQVFATHYVNSGNTVTLPTVQDFKPEDYKEYVIAFSEGFTSATPVNANKNIIVSISKKEVHQIATKNDWIAFCDRVKAGERTLNAKLTANVDLGKPGDESELQSMILGIDEAHAYSGLLDGNGYTITLDRTALRAASLIGVAQDAVIRNLRLQGKASSDAPMAGLIANAMGTTAIQSCRVDMDLTAQSAAASQSAVFIAQTSEGSAVTISDCIAAGKFEATGDATQQGWSGFVAQQNGNLTIANSLYLGTNNAAEGSYTFASNATIENCYYLNACGTAQGTPTTEEQIKSGELANLLQANREVAYWGQVLGTDDAPLLTADLAKMVHKVTFYDRKGENVIASHLVNNGKTVTPPTPQEIMGDAYNGHYYYTVSFTDDFNATTPVTYNLELRTYIHDYNYFPISTKEDWLKFCEMQRGDQPGINGWLRADIDLGTPSSEEELRLMTLGSPDKPYDGSLDGSCQTITIDRTDAYAFSLIGATRGAIIAGIRLKGKLSSNSPMAGLIAYADGNTNVSKCWVDMDFTSNSERASQSAAFILQTAEGSDVTISDCLVTGKFEGQNEAAQKGWSGFVAQQGGKLSFYNCLYLGTNNATDDSYTFAPDASFNNCYYRNVCGAVQGTQATEDQLKSGYLAHQLQENRDKEARSGWFWGQELGKDNEPNPIIEGDSKWRRVYKVDFIYNDQLYASHYVNRERTVTPPAVEDFPEETGGNPSEYKVAFLGGFTASTPITDNKSITFVIRKKDGVEIATKEDWKEFCDRVKDGDTNLKVKLVDNIDLGSDVLMVGTAEKPYRGIFDGQGYSITMNWDVTYGESLYDTSYDGRYGLFLYIEGATIRNLHTRGSITCWNTYAHISGMVWNAEGTVTIENSSVIMDLKASGSGLAQSAGMVHKMNGNSDDDRLTITDCVVGGRFLYRYDEAKNDWCGFVRTFYDEPVCTLTNCLYMGENSATWQSYTFVQKFLDHPDRLTLNNCYYLNAIGEKQGTKVTAEQLKGGAVAKLLQAGRKDKCYWAQVLGEIPTLFDENETSEDNYVHYDTASDKWTCDKVQMTDGKAMPVTLDFHANTVSAERSLTAKKIHTITLPFAWREAGKAYELSSVSGKVAHFKEVTVADGATYEAYKPYLFVPESDVTNISASDLTINAEPAAPMSIEQNGVKFTACYAGMSNEEAAAAGAYILQGDKQWHKVMAGNAAVNIPAYRAYITQESESEAKTLSISFDDETTGISAIETTDLDGTMRYYDLSGRYIGTSLKGQPRGVYVGNGKKILKK